MNPIFSLVILGLVGIFLIIIGSYSASAAQSVKKQANKTNDEDLKKAQSEFNTGAWIGLGTGIALLVLVAIVVTTIFLAPEFEPQINMVFGKSAFVLGVLAIVVILMFWAGIAEAKGVSSVKNSTAYQESTGNQRTKLDKAIDDGKTAAGVYLGISCTVIAIIFVIGGYQFYEWEKKHKRDKAHKKTQREKADDRAEAKKLAAEEKIHVHEMKKKHADQFELLQDAEVAAQIAVTNAAESAAKAKSEEVI